MRSRFFFSLLICSFCFTTYAQQPDTSFLKEWFTIDTLILERGQNKTALTKVNELYRKAVQKNLPSQKIKALIYRYAIENTVTEKGKKEIVADLINEISSEKEPVVKQLLQLLLAKKISLYFNDYRWQIYNRKKTTISEKDMDTWSMDDFYKKISSLYLDVLRNEKTLQSIPIQQFDAVLVRGTKRYPNTSLYDLAIQEALDFFKAGHSYISKPIETFTLTNEKSLAPLPDFIREHFPTTDSNSAIWNSLMLYKKLLNHHSNDTNKNFLLSLDLERINWVLTHASFLQKEEKYETTLRLLTEQYPTNPITAEIWSQLAQLYINKAYTYSPFGDTTQRYAYVTAKKIIEKALGRFDNSLHAVQKMKNQLSQIQQQQMMLKTEQVNLIHQPFRAKLDFRNVDSIYIRILRLDDKEIPTEQVWENNFWKKITRVKTVKTLALALPKTNDHQLHATEIALPGLPAGNYALLCSNDLFFHDSLSHLRYLPFIVSNISYIKNGSDFFVVHRETGKPLPNVNVTIQRQVYNTTTRKNEYQTVSKPTTDKNGYFSFTEKNNSGLFRYSFETKNDQLRFQQGDYEYLNAVSNEEPLEPDMEEQIRYEKNARQVFFFTDRSIYRPGQTVYFKGIGVTRSYETKTSKLLTKDSGWVILQDVNRKKIDSLPYVINEFGSFSGKFQLPAKVLTGSFSIYTTGIKNGSALFSVEEYKRPTYAVSFEQPKGSYRLNDSINLTGNAKAFAGNTIDGAKVVYNITRYARTLYPWYRRGPSRTDNSREISNGNLTTDASGNFNIRFKANADDITKEENTNTLFTFTINATVTDANGETRTASTDINIGYQSLQLGIESPKLTDSKHLKEIGIKATNLSNEPEPVTVSIKIYALRTPERLIRKRLWEKPDQFLMSEKEFTTLFPHDEYASETEMTEWPVQKLVQETLINTKTVSALILNQPLPAGQYKIEAIATDKDGKEVKALQYTTVFNSQLAQMPFETYQFNLNQKTTAEPGDTASYISGSDAKDLFVIQKTERKNKKAKIEYQQREKGLSVSYFTVEETDRGGFAVAEAYVLHNRLYNYQTRIEVPWTNKQLTVHYSSYRNKTEPGSKETWTVQVKGQKNEQVSAELLTTMYDASLDQFRNHQLSAPSLWPIHYLTNGFTAGRNFTSVGAYDNPVVSWNYLPEGFDTNDRLAESYYDLYERNIRNWITYSGSSVSDKLKKHVEKMLENITTYNFNGRAAGVRIEEEYNKVAMREVAAAAPPAAMSSADKMMNISIRGNANLTTTGLLFVVNGKIVAGTPNITPDKILSSTILSREEAVAKYGAAGLNGAILITTSDNVAPVTIRKNFSETAFFFPHLYTDTAGNYSFSFTMPDALTRWKWMSLAHTKDLAFGSSSTNIVTQKTLMVQANAPRFVREGDKMELSAKVSNLSDKELSGQVTLELVDAATGTSVDGWFQNVFPVQYFTAAAGQSTAIKFPVQIPFSFNKTLTWRLTARANNYSDGEENMIPVLTNRQLVTESLPILITRDTTQSFRFEKLLQTNSQSLTHEAITINYTTNPIWEAIRALPYLMEYPYECVEQTFNRFYANALGSYIVNRDPKIRKVFESWLKDTATAKSKLQLNESLKQIMLEETPWVFAAQSEEEQQKNIALLFDMFRLSQQTDQLLQKLQDMQLPDGSFSWFKGGYGDRYMTNYVITGLGKLKRIGALTPDVAIRLKTLIEKSVLFLDEEINKEYQYWKKLKLDTTRTLISGTHIQYLYMRSFYRDIALPKYAEAYNFFYNRGKLQIQQQSIYHRALLGLVYFRNNEIRYVNVNLRSAVLENAVRDSVRATLYWKDRVTYSWYQTPTEHQSTIIQFLQELQQGQPMFEGNKSIDEARNWLLLNKQTNHWKTTMATAEACYALLMTGTDLLHTEKNIRIQLGNNSYSNQDRKTEAGTGYFQQRIEGRFVKPEMGNIKVTVQTKGAEKIQSPSWGSIYWQYFEDMDKITTSATPLSISKQLFIERNSTTGKVLEPVTENNVLKPGDKLVIRLILKSDREMEYLHLKDTRASTMEPVNVLSGYKWQDGLGYYESTKDASTNFFISHLRKGTYVFDYPVFITHTGVFSTGNASIQCMYAPEFVANSGGMKIRVEE
jgi:uncharacterized protein YfaS (alpha-2-macroglobulin family)